MTVKIIVDNREFGTKTVSELSKWECVVIPRQLSIGDFILSKRVGVERKTTEDFWRSIIDNRLFKQIEELKKTFEKPILIIEGNGLYTNPKINSNSIRGALASIAIDFQVPILHTSNPSETAGLLYWIAKREQENKRNFDLKIRVNKKIDNLKDAQIFLISGLPFIDKKRAEALLKKFGTPEKIFTADEKQLSETEGIGKKISRKIREVLTSDFNI
ncbi:MAG: ERCC4 domain-containing protein [Candidatus Aenigmatarchaeota archaeon]|nr:hypothetical protein [Candidatus Aenigmarchaeota archaeon]